MKTDDKIIAAVLGIGLLTLVGAVMFWQRSVQRWIENDRLQSRAYEIVQCLERIEGHLTMAETGRRDYAIAALAKDMRALRQVTPVTLQQEQRWNQFETLLNQRLTQLQEQADTTSSPQNEKMQEQLRSLLREIGNEEKQRLHHQIEKKEFEMFSTVKVITIITTVGTFLFLCVFYLLRREVRARRVAEEQIRQEHAALEKAMRELEESHWHLDKVAEFLPICMECGKVKTAGTEWETIADYFRKNNLLFTHGYCPECAAKVRAHYEQDIKKKAPQTPAPPPPNPAAPSRPATSGSC